MRPIFHKIHMWLSVPFGLIITLICFSGASLVFEKEITQFVQNGQLQIDNTSQSSTHNELINQKPKRLPFFNVMYQTHRWLLDKPEHKSEISLGKMIVGTNTLLFAITLVSGTIAWIPKTRNRLKNSLKIKRGKCVWRDIHVAGGVYIFIPLLLMSLTGLLWSFDWYRIAICDLLNSDFKELKTFFYSIHTGSWGGNTTRIIWFLSAIIGSTLPLSGYYLWLRRLRTKYNRQL